MILKKTNKIFSFFIIYFYTISIFAVIYFFQFILDFNNVNYVYCSEIEKLKIFQNFNFYYPKSCDAPTYFLGVENFQKLYKLENYQYLNRPIFLFFIFFINYFLKNIFIENIYNLELSFFVFQSLLVVLNAFLIKKIFEKIFDKLKINIYLIIFVLLISPLFKWHMLDVGHQTLTTLVFTLTVYSLTFKKKTIFYFIISILFFAHRSFIVVLIIALIYDFLNINKDFKKLLKIILSSFTPFLFYFILYKIFNINFYDHNQEYYRQFIWVLDPFNVQSKNIIEGWYCQTLLLNYKCYLFETLKFLVYCSVPILNILFLVIKLRNKIIQVHLNFLNSLIISTLSIYLFWSFIGWHPPIRFIYYSLGNGLIFFILYFLFLIKDKLIKSLFLLSVSLYFLFLNHWNLKEVLQIDLWIIISFLLLLINIYIVNTKFKNIL